MKKFTFTLALAMSALSATTTLAYSKKVDSACAGDYQSYCSQYTPKSAAMRRCFESNRKNLSRTCINALIDAGQVPRKYRKR